MDMRLYRMELYKLLYKKIFRFGLLAVQGILCFQIAVQGIHSGIHDFISSFFVGGIQVFFNLIIYAQN